MTAAASPLNPGFWFVMSIALCAGFLVAYPVNWWLVAKGMKHGMKTVMPDGTAPPLAAGLALAGATLARASHPGRDEEAVGNASRDERHAPAPAGAPPRSQAMAGHAMRPGGQPQSGPSRLELAAMVAATFALLAAGAVAAGLAGSLLGT